MKSLEVALTAVEKGSESSTTTAPLTTREMASEVSAELGIEAAPLTELVERASAMLGLEFGEEEAPLIERLRALHDEVCCSAHSAAALASIPLDELSGDAEALAPFI